MIGMKESAPDSERWCSSMNALAVSRILRMSEITERTGLSRRSIERKWDQGSKYYDETFPAKLKLGESAVGVYEHELARWCRSLGVKASGGRSC